MQINIRENENRFHWNWLVVYIASVIWPWLLNDYVIHTYICEYFVLCIAFFSSSNTSHLEWFCVDVILFGAYFAIYTFTCISIFICPQHMFPKSFYIQIFVQTNRAYSSEYMILYTITILRQPSSQIVYDRLLAKFQQAVAAALKTLRTNSGFVVVEVLLDGSRCSSCASEPSYMIVNTSSWVLLFRLLFYFTSELEWKWDHR